MKTEGRGRKQEYDRMVRGLYDNLEEEVLPQKTLSDTSLLRELDQISDRYTDPQLIAQGGMKKIFRVTDTMTDRPVAMAVIHGLESPEVVEQFIREARINAQLEHPNVMPVYDMGLDADGEPFFTMKLITGDNLNTVIKGLRNGDSEYVQRFDLATRLDIFVKVCDAVAYAHSKGVLHLDLKPENVQIGLFGEVLVCDWGLSRYTDPLPDATKTDDVDDSVLTRLGSVCGTPGYLSPEQVTKKRVDLDERSDVYGLGALLYTLLTLKVSVEGDGAEEMMEATVSGHIQPPSARCDHDVPTALEAVCMHALKTEPDKRYHSVDALKMDVVNYVKGYATAAENAGFGRMLTLLVKRHRPVSITLAIVTLLGLILVGLFTWSLSKKERLAREKARLAELNAQEALANLALFRSERMKTETIGREVIPEMENKVIRDLENFNFVKAWEGIKRAVSVRPNEGVFRKLQACMLMGDHQFAEAYAKLSVHPTAELRDYLEFSRGFAKDRHQSKRLDRKRMTAYLEILHKESLDFAIVPFLKNATEDFVSPADRADFVRELTDIMNPNAAPVRMRWKKVTENSVVLDFSGNPKLTSIAAIALLPVTDLDVSDTGVRRMTIANQLPILRLNVSGSQVMRLNGLRQSSVRYLDMSDTPVTDLSPLESSSVKELIMLRSAVIDLSPLKRLPYLHKVVISDTDANRRRLKELNLPDRIRVILR